MAARGERRDELAAHLGFLAVALVVGWPSLFGTLWFNDFGAFNLPVRAFFGAGWRAGELRWWCAELGCGYPLFAEGQAGAAYPPNLLFALLEPTRALSWSVLLHVALAGAGVYRLLRAFGVRRGAAWAGGVVYLLSGPVYFRALHLNFLHGLTWLPWWLAAVEALARGRRGAVWAAAGTLALILLAGHAQPPLIAVTLGAAYLVARLVMLERPSAADLGALLVALSGLGLLLAAVARVPRAAWLVLPGLVFGGGWLLQLAGHPARRAVLRGLGAFAVAGALAGLLAAVQLLPLLELAPNSMRGDLPPVSWRCELALQPGQLIELLAPRRHGTPYRLDVGTTLRWGYTHHWEWCPHVGLMPLLLLLLTPLIGRRRERWLAVGLAAAALLLALGTTFPVYAWLAELPGWNRVRGPNRLLGVWALGTAMACAFTIDDLQDAPPEGRRRLFAAAGAMLFGIVAAGWAVDHLRAAPVIDDAVVRVGLVRASWRALLVGLAAAAVVLARRPLGARWALVASALIAVDMLSAGVGYQNVRDRDWYAAPPEAADVRPEQRVWADLYQVHPFEANRSLLYPGIENVGLYTPLTLWNWDGVRQKLNAMPLDSVPARRWLALWGVTRAAPVQLRRKPEAGPLLELDVRPFPRVWVSPRWLAAATYEQALELAMRPDWRPEADTIFSRPQTVAPRRGELPEVVWTEIGRHRITARVNARQPCALVVAQTFYPGWRVHQNGAWRSAEPADAALCGAIVEAGETRVDLVYQPVSIRLGLFLTLAGLALLAGASAGSRR